jgi:hypothetical protein
VNALCLGSPAEVPDMECLSFSQQTINTSMNDSDAVQAMILGRWNSPYLTFLHASFNW